MRVWSPESYGRVPLPATLPGAFFVLEWDRDAETYVLVLDDEDRSSYDLGDDVNVVRNEFTSRGYPKPKVNELVDQAREFGASQYIPSEFVRVEHRVLPIIPRDAKRAVIDFDEAQENGRFKQLRRR